MIDNFNLISDLMTTREIGLIIINASQGLVIIETETEIIACWTKEGESLLFCFIRFNVY
jgi:hypothetical protein